MSADQYQASSCTDFVAIFVPAAVTGAQWAVWRVYWGASARQSAMKLRDHGRYDFEPLPTRPAGCWPGSARLALYVALNLEQYSFGEGLVEDLVPPLGQPDALPNCRWARRR